MNMPWIKRKYLLVDHTKKKHNVEVKAMEGKYTRNDLVAEAERIEKLYTLDDCKNAILDKKYKDGYYRLIIQHAMDIKVERHLRDILSRVPMNETMAELIYQKIHKDYDTITTEQIEEHYVAHLVRN